MNRAVPRILTALAASLVLLGGCGSTAPKTAPLKSSKDLTIGYGTLGPAKIGMTQKAAQATGVFDTKGPDPVEGCPAPLLTWKARFKHVDVISDKAGIRSLGVLGPGPVTAKDIGVGSTLDDIKDAYGKALQGPREAGYGQAGAYLKRGDAWIGFLFNDQPKELTSLSQVLFIEVQRGQRPDLMRDGC